MEPTTHKTRFAFFALATALGICSTASLHCGDSSSGGAASDASVDGQSGSCPVGPPTVGSPCAIEGTACNYPGRACECCVAAAPYICTGGKWTEQPTGGPPSGGTCPATVPVQGTPCGPTCGAQLFCTYDCAHGNGANSTATCQGTWQVQQFASPCSADDAGADASVDANDASDASDEG